MMLTKFISFLKETTLPLSIVIGGGVGLFAITFPALNRLFFGSWLDSFHSHAANIQGNPADSTVISGVTTVIKVRMQDGIVDDLVEPLFVLLPLFIIFAASFLKMPIETSRVRTLILSFLVAVIYLPAASILSMKFESPESFTPMGSGAWFLVILCNPVSGAVIVAVLFGVAVLVLSVRQRMAVAASQLKTPGSL